MTAENDVREMLDRLEDYIAKMRVCLNSGDIESVKGWVMKIDEFIDTLYLQVDRL